MIFIKINKFGPKKYEIKKKLKTIPISKCFVIWCCDFSFTF